MRIFGCLRTNRRVLGQAELAVAVEVNVLAVVCVVVDANPKQILVEGKATVGCGGLQRGVEEEEQGEEKDEEQQRFKAPEHKQHGKRVYVAHSGLRIHRVKDNTRIVKNRIRGETK